MSISRVIIKSKTNYEKSFQYTENDEHDLGYFVAYNLRVLSISFKQLKEYINRKQREKKNANAFMSLGNINERQAQIIQHFVEEPSDVVTVKDVQNMFGVSTVTARKDLSELIERGFLVDVQINNVKRGYTTSENFDNLIHK
jgi:Fic family protein